MICTTIGWNQDTLLRDTQVWVIPMGAGRCPLLRMRRGYQQYVHMQGAHGPAYAARWGFTYPRCRTAQSEVWMVPMTDHVVREMRE